MPISSGARLGPYEVIAAIGAGGMGEVYRARDTRLDRVVALKVIQPAAAASQEMRDRFEREARAISALDHPHICTLFDVCREGDVSFLVMQYLEGETLADRLVRAGKPASDPSRPSSGGEAALSTVSRGPIPFETALKFAAEIAQALDAAHRRGIVHRDLKPGNVMLTKAGTKLLDFGLAKLMTNGAGPTGFAAAGDATRTSPFGAAQGGPLTGAGAILGTLYYMPPEQLEGREVDSRSDIHAFGAVLFEMLSGRRAFDGQSQAGIIAAIISTDAPTLTSLADAKTALPVVSRRALDRLLAKCLAKDPDDRWQSAADLAAELQWINEERLRAAPEVVAGAVADPAAAARARRRERILTSVAAAAIIALAAVSYWWYPRPAPPPAPITFTIDAPPSLAMANGPGLMSVSPDGRRVAFVTGSASFNQSQLWVRNLDSLTSQRLASVDRAWHPVWSPDSKSIAFTESGPASLLHAVDVATGIVRTIAPSATGRAAWSHTGVIVFESGHKLFRVPEGSGTPVPAMELDASRQETDLSWPVFLPDGRRYLFLAQSSIAAKTGIFLASLDSMQRTFLVNARSNVEYAGGYLFYQREGTLIAHAFDADSGRLMGDEMSVVEDVRYNGGNGRAAFSVSASGVLVYAAGDNTALADRARVMLFDRSGTSSKQIGAPGPYSSAVLSPDGRRAVVSLQSSEALGRTLSILDIERGLLTPFTIGAVEERYPIWSHDGSSVIFASARQGTWGLYRRSAAGGATQDEPLFSAPEQLYSLSLSPDDRVLLFGRGAFSVERVWALPLTGDGKPVEAIPGLATMQFNATFSPDGKWIAFGAGTTGDIYIQPYPATDVRERISSSAGRFPYWTPDNRHVIYRSTDDDFISVELTPNGRTFRPSLPVKLFNSPHAAPGNWSYSMDAAREKFLMVVPAERPEVPTSTPLTVIVNWVQSLKKQR